MGLRLDCNCLIGWCMNSAKVFASLQEFGYENTPSGLIGMVGSVRSAAWPLYVLVFVI